MRRAAILLILILMSGAAAAKGSDAEAKVKCKAFVVRCQQLYDATLAMPPSPSPKTDAGRAEYRRRLSVLEGYKAELWTMMNVLEKADYPEEYVVADIAGAQLHSWISDRYQLQKQNLTLEGSTPNHAREKEDRAATERKLGKAKAFVGL